MVHSWWKQNRFGGLELPLIGTSSSEYPSARSHPLPHGSLLRYRTRSLNCGHKLSVPLKRNSKLSKLVCTTQWGLNDYKSSSMSSGAVNVPVSDAVLHSITAVAEHLDDPFGLCPSKCYQNYRAVNSTHDRKSTWMCFSSFVRSQHLIGITPPLPGGD